MRTCGCLTALRSEAPTSLGLVVNTISAPSAIACSTRASAFSPGTALKYAVVSTLPGKTASSWVRPNSCWLVHALVSGVRSWTKATFRWLGPAGRIPGSRRLKSPFCWGAGSAGLSLTVTGSSFCSARTSSHRASSFSLSWAGVLSCNSFLG